MAGDEIVTRTGKTWLDETHGIMRFRAFAQAEQTLEDARENMVAVEKIIGTAGKRYPMLVDLSLSKALGPEARAHYGKSESRSNYLALAILGNSPVGKVLANAWLAIYGNRDAPTRVFTNEADALEWLKSFKT